GDDLIGRAVAVPVDGVDERPGLVGRRRVVGREGEGEHLAGDGGRRPAHRHRRRRVRDRQRGRGDGLDAVVVGHPQRDGAGGGGREDFARGGGAGQQHVEAGVAGGVGRHRGRAEVALALAEVGRVGGAGEEVQGERRVGRAVQRAGGAGGGARPGGREGGEV